MPGARHLSTPVISSTAAAIDATSMKERPSSQISAPMPDWLVSLVNGGYMNQPACGPASNSTEPATNRPPKRKDQKPKAESRGNGKSRAPSMSGSRMIAKASRIGTANRNIIAEPCIVISWLYVPASSSSLPGTASCARISSASTPANRKKKQAVAAYQTPTCVLLTSVQ